MTLSEQEGTRSAADRALTPLLEEQFAEGLRWAAAWAEENPTRPLGPWLLARFFQAMERPELACRGFELSAQVACQVGSFGLAAASYWSLKACGVDSDALREQIASIFSEESGRLSGPPQLPAFPASGAEVQPLEEEDVLKASEAVLSRLESEHGDKVEASEVPPQRLLSLLGRQALMAMLDVFELELVASGAKLVTQGEPGAEAYIVARGALEVVRKDSDGGSTLLARLGAGSLFGEMALLSRSPRAASVIASGPAMVLVARKSLLDELAAQLPEVGRVLADYCRRRMIDNLLRTSPLLAAVSVDERPLLIQRFTTRSFESGARVIEQGQESDGLHLIASGEVSVVRQDDAEGIVIASLGPGQVVGEVALVLRRPANADVVANHPTVTLHLSRERFLELIRQHPQLLAQLYELAVQRDEETTSIVAQEAAEVDDSVLL